MIHNAVQGLGILLALAGGIMLWLYCLGALRFVMDWILGGECESPFSLAAEGFRTRLAIAGGAGLAGFLLGLWILS